MQMKEKICLTGLLLGTNHGHIQERIQELQWELLEHPPYSPDLGQYDLHLLVANVSLMTKRSKRRCGSG
jgi:hypothetical protein